MVHYTGPVAIARPVTSLDSVDSDRRANAVKAVVCLAIDDEEIAMACGASRGRLDLSSTLQRAFATLIRTSILAAFHGAKVDGPLHRLGHLGSSVGFKRVTPE